ncbi:hypothetical protein Tco_1320448 [Tanacetum coccineum]
MVRLTFADSHNMVAYLEKSTENADFAEIVDFMNVNPIRYALTVSLTIYVSCIEQFWSTAKIKTVNNETQIHAKKPKKVTEIPQSSEPTTLVTDEVVHEERGNSMERAATTATSLDAEQDSGGRPRRQETMGDKPAQTRFESLSKQSYDSPLKGVNTPQSDEDIIELKELMELCTKLSERVLDLETTKTDQAKEIVNLKKRVKKIERKRNDVDEDLDAVMDEAIEHVYEVDTVDKVLTDDAVNTASTEVNTVSAPVTTAGVSVSTAGENIATVEPSTPPTTITTDFEDEDLTIAQTLMKMRSEKSKVRGVVMKEPSETATRPTVPPQQYDLKDKVKGTMVKQEKPLKKNDQIKFYEEISQRLEA